MRTTRLRAVGLAAAVTCAAAASACLRIGYDDLEPEPDSGSPLRPLAQVDSGAGVPVTTDDSDAGAVARDCGAGVSLAGACWYLGARGESCTSACARHGGYVPEVRYVGVAAEGGSLARCDMLLDLLVGPGDTSSGTRLDDKPLGCHLYDGARWWLINGPVFDPAVSERVTQLACSCQGP